MSSATLDRAPAPAAVARPRISLKRAFMGAALIAILAGAGLYGRYWWTTGRFLETTDDAYVGGEVTVMAPKVAGFITDVAVKDNQAVKPGDLLFRIDDRPFKAELARADASVEAQQAALVNLDANRRLQEATIAGVRADLAAVQAEVVRTHFDFDRYKALSNDQNASQQRFQQADADWKKAQAAVVKTGAAIDAAERRLDVIDTQKQQTLAALAVAKAEREIAALNLGYTEVRAPIEGVIGNRSARVGAYATVGAALISLVPARGLWVDANFKENQLATMRAGETAIVEADVLPGVRFIGHVESLAPATGAQFSVLPPENATGNFTKIVQRVPVRILLDGDAATLGRLRPGLSVTASIDRRTGGEAFSTASLKP